MPLRKVWQIIRNLPTTSAFGRAVDPEQWRAEHHILANIFDALASANWQRGGDDGVKRPAPYPRPGVPSEEDQERARFLEQVEKFRANPMSEGR